MLEARKINETLGRDVV